MFTLAGFLLLRRTRPQAERPIRLGPVWVTVAAGLVVINVAMVVIGFTHPGLVGYGGGTEQLISLTVIAAGMISYLYARFVQDGQRGRALWHAPPQEAPVTPRRSPP